MQSFVRDVFVLAALIACFENLGLAQDADLSSAGAELHAVAPAAQSIASRIQPQTYDFTRAIEAHVKQSQLPADDARAEAIKQLLIPMAGMKRPIKHREVKPNVFEVWATESFHKLLPSIIAWMEHDRKQITIALQVVTVDERGLKQLHETFQPHWEFSAVREPQHPDIVSRTAVRPASFKAPINSSTTLSATTHTSRHLPTRIAHLDAAQTKSLVDRLQSDAAASFEQSPKVTIFPEQQATISDTSQRPFVVAVEPVRGDLATAVQPVIEVLEDGLTIDFKASLEEQDVIRLNSVVTFKRIGNVEEFTFSNEELGETTVQIPEQTIRSIQVSRAFQAGTTLLIDPIQVDHHTISRRFRKPQTQRRYTLILLTPTIIHDTIDFAAR